MKLFFTETGLIGSEPHRLVLLAGQEAFHAVRVMRIRPGETLHATDGKGTIWQGRVISATPQEVLAEVTGTESHPRPAPRISMAIGFLHKRDRMEFAVEKAVELGVAELLLFRGDHSEKHSLRTERMEAAALAAMKQSLRAWLPRVTLFDNLESLLGAPGPVRIIVADETSGEEAQPDPAGWRREERVLFVVAPEGGFSERERELLREKRAGTVSLGRYRLRTETAVAALASLFIPMASNREIPRVAEGNVVAGTDQESYRKVKSA